MFTGGGYLGKAALAAVVASLLTFGGLAYSPVMAAGSDSIVHSSNDNGGIAIGEDSVPGRDAGKNNDEDASQDKAGYDATGKQHARSDKDYATWVSTDAAVSVGGAESKVKYKDKEGKDQTQTVKSTRQITNLAAGTQDTDAVNVAQLKASAENLSTTINSTINKKVAVIFDDKGSLMSTDATIKHEHENGYHITNVSKGIALGHNAYVFNQGGGKADAMLFGSPTYTSGIAIGENAYVLEDSIDLGNKIYKGAMGDVSDLSKYDAKTSSGTGRLLIGNNSYSSGTLSTLIGNHSIMTTNYLNGRRWNAMQNAGAVSIGALNSIESYSSDSNMSGVANSIIGLANKTTNANGALILGAGNEIKNSITSISVSGSASTDVATASQAIRNRMANGYAGGATLVIGGGNKADYTQKTQIIGVNNKVTGTEGTTADFNLIDGYKNTATHVKHATVIGSGNTVSGEETDNVEGLILLGDNRNVWKQADHSVVIGSSDDAGHSYVTRPDTVVIGHNAYIEDHGGNTSGGGDIAIGHNSFVENYVNQSGSIAFGENTHVRNSVGSTENAFVLGQYETTQDPAGTPIPTDVAKMNASIAIGENTFARTGSLMVGTHKYTGEIGDTTVDTSDATSMAQANQQINETVLGTNSFSLGAFSTVTGAYSIISGDYENGKWRNFGSSITGSLNSIESKTATTADAGNASHIIGTANRMQNANGAVVIGSGNEITDSYAAMSMPTSNNTSAKDLSEKIRKSIKANGGGAAAIVGNGNEVKKSTNVAVMGSKNSVTSTTNSQIFGDNRAVTGADGAPIDGAVIIGSASGTTPMTTDKKNVTILGHNANATVEGGVALGAGSVASRDAQVAGYDPSTKDASIENSAIWKATDAAVSVGKADGSMTRQITGVAAGTELTDAVNVAQLQKALAGAKDGNDTLKSSTDALKLDGNTLSMNIQDTAGHTVSGSVDLSKLAQAVDTNTTYTLTGQANKDNTTTITLKDNNNHEDTVKVATKDTRNTVKAGENVILDTKDNADGSHEYTVNVKADGKVEAGSTKIVSGDTVYNETRVAKDGTFVKQANTAGENLSALDNQVTANTESIYHMNGRISDLDNRVNKVGAGAAALAALHPLDFDPDDKWDFAVGYGNYRNANSVAFGAFYRPNEDTMFSLGTNFGNGENMFNAGLSFKIGQGSGITTSKTAMAKKIESLEDTVDKQDKKIAELEALVKEQGEMIRQYVGKK